MHGYRVFSVCLFLFGLLHHPTSICMVTGYFQFVCFYSDSFITPQAYAWLQGIFSLFVFIRTPSSPHKHMHGYRVFSVCLFLFGLLHHPTSICMVTGYFQFVCFYSDSFITPQAYAWLQGIFSLFVFIRTPSSPHKHMHGYRVFSVCLFLFGLLHHPTSICMVTGYFQFVCFSRTPSSPHKHMHGYRVFSVCLFLFGLLHHPTSICMVTGYFQFVCFYSDSFITPQAYAWLQGIFSLFVFTRTPSSPHKHMHGYRVFSVCLFLFGLLHHPTSICMVTGYFQFVCFYSDSFITPQAYAWLQGIFSLFVFIRTPSSPHKHMHGYRVFSVCLFLFGLLHHPTSICMVTGYFQFVCFTRTPSSAHKHMHGYRVFSVCLF